MLIEVGLRNIEESKMTYQQLNTLVIDFLTRKDGDREASIAYVRAAGLPRAILEAALQAFLTQAKEDDVTKVLRHQILYLQEKGHFDLVD